jgi:hypothetical protein
VKNRYGGGDLFDDDDHDFVFDIVYFIYDSIQHNGYFVSNAQKLKVIGNKKNEINHMLIMQFH